MKPCHMSKNLIKSLPMKVISEFSSKIKDIRQYSVKHWKRIALITVLLVVVFFIYRKITSEPKGIATDKVYRTTLVSDFSANGRIKAKREANLKFNSPGKVAWISVKEGDKVRAWQAIAGLDTVSLNATYQQARNNLRNYQAIAEKVLDDVKDHASDETFTQKATRTTAEVNRDNAYESVLSAQDNLKNAVLVSPIAGTVVNINDLVSELNLSGGDIDTRFIRIVDFSTLYFEAQVDEIDYSKVKVGQEVSVNVDAYPGESCNGTLSFIIKEGKETTGGVVTIPAEITLTNCGLDLAVGLNGQAHFILGKLDNVLVIPKKYIVNKNGQDYVWKQVGESTKNRKLTPIEVGTTSSTQAEIIDGVSEGDKIVFIPSK